MTFTEQKKDIKLIETSFTCHNNCGYRNIHDIKMLSCDCGKGMQGILVYRKIGHTVIFETRQKRKGGRLETEQLIRRG
jgi:hypothetical protein